VHIDAPIIGDSLTNAKYPDTSIGWWDKSTEFWMVEESFGLDNNLGHQTPHCSYVILSVQILSKVKHCGNKVKRTVDASTVHVMCSLVY